MLLCTNYLNCNYDNTVRLISVMINSLCKQLKVEVIVIIAVLNTHGAPNYNI